MANRKRNAGIKSGVFRRDGHRSHVSGRRFKMTPDRVDRLVEDVKRLQTELHK